jgi:acetoin utilization protein AcuB
MGLFCLESGRLSPYSFVEDSGEDGGADSIEAAFRRLKENCGPSLEADLRPVLVAEQIMSSALVTVRETDSLQEALQLMSQEGFRHLPVVAEPGPRLLGIVSDRDGLLMSADLESEEMDAMTVAGVMTTELITAAPETEIRLLAQTMVEYKISSLPVLDLDGLLVGIVTTSDVLRSIASHAPLDLWV